MHNVSLLSLRPRWRFPFATAFFIALFVCVALEAQTVTGSVAGVLADPKLEIHNAAGVKIAENDSWNALLQPVARGVGAFDLTLGSRDAALLLTLAPGTYTAQISGIGGTTGEAIVEVYEVP